MVVNNAGLGMAGFLDTTYDDWEQILDVNLWGVIRGSRAFGRLMVDNGEVGHIDRRVTVVRRRHIRAVLARPPGRWWTWLGVSVPGVDTGIAT